MPKKTSKRRVVKEGGRTYKRSKECISLNVTDGADIRRKSVYISADELSAIDDFVRDVKDQGGYGSFSRSKFLTDLLRIGAKVAGRMNPDTITNDEKFLKQLIARLREL